MTRGDTFHVLLDGLEVAKRGHPVQALNVAQGRAERVYSGPVTLTIERHPVIGPTSLLYRVDRDDIGTVRTTVISQED